MNTITRQAAVVAAGLSFVPFMAFAQDAEPSISYFTTFLKDVAGFIQTAIPVAFAAILLGILVGLAIYMFNPNNDDAKSRGRSLMIWGVVALFVAASVWGLVAVLQQISGVDDSEVINAPGVEELEAIAN
jgi:formate/nitrite transporter FocA (FNT family)